MLATALILACYATGAYGSYKTLKQPNASLYQLQQWAAFWVVVSGLRTIEPVMEYLFFWMPFYSQAKLFLLLGIIVRNTKITTAVFRRVVHPFLHKQAWYLDQLEKRWTGRLQQARTRLSRLANMPRVLQIKARTSAFIMYFFETPSPDNVPQDDIFADANQKVPEIDGDAGVAALSVLRLTIGSRPHDGGGGLDSEEVLGNHRTVAEETPNLTPKDSAVDLCSPCDEGTEDEAESHDEGGNGIGDVHGLPPASGVGVLEEGSADGVENGGGADTLNPVPPSGAPASEIRSPPRHAAKRSKLVRPTARDKTDGEAPEMVPAVSGSSRRQAHSKSVGARRATRPDSRMKQAEDVNLDDFFAKTKEDGEANSDFDVLVEQQALMAERQLAAAARNPKARRGSVVRRKGVSSLSGPSSGMVGGKGDSK
ncbi:hypothetical protein HK104_000880 [Borealophlyctis nickersoniae]|nr:hypothetical protein HK104_000880 [Borealophlyctis nickersoniae]